MITLKTPINLKGGIVDKGKSIALPPELEKKMVESGCAEYCNPGITKEAATQPPDSKPIEKLTKSELLEYAGKIGIKDIIDTMTKAEIIARIEANGKS